MIRFENENEFYRLVGMVAKMAVRVNQETEYCVFFDFSGHVDGFALRISRSKSGYTDWVYDKKSYAQIGMSETEVLREFHKILLACLNSTFDEALLEAA